MRTPQRIEVPVAAARPESPKAKPPATKLFSSLTRVDEELRQKAADVDAEQAKASRKNTGDQEEDNRDPAGEESGQSLRTPIRSLYIV